MIYRGLLLCILAGSLAAAQECTRIVPINVVDRHTGHQIDPLDSQQLRAHTGSTILPISGLEKFNTGRVLVLIDLSGSMQGEAAVAKDLGSVLVQSAPANARIAFGFFHDKIVISPGFTGDPKDLDPLIEQARQTPADGKTLLLDAIHQGLQLFHQPGPGDAIVVITDGGDNVSKTTRHSVLEELRAAGVRFYSLLMAHYSIIPEDFDGENWLDEAARDTGGETIYDIRTTNPALRTNPRWKMGMNDALLIFWQGTILHEYSISLKVPAEIRTPRKWKLEIADKNDKRLKHAAIYYPRYLAPCGTLQPDARSH